MRELKYEEFKQLKVEDKLAQEECYRELVNFVNDKKLTVVSIVAGDRKGYVSNILYYYERDI